MFRTLSQVSATESLDFDLCIIGAGAAGITIANKLRESKLRICLLEGGRLDGGADGQGAIYQGVSQGYSPLVTSRMRFFGGTTNHWAGYCRLPNDEDLAAREWEPLSGWPIAISDLKPYLSEAMDMVEVTNHFDAEYWAKSSGFPTLGLESPELYEDVSLVGPPVRFREKYRGAIDASSITCLLDANVVEIVPSATADRIEHVRLKTLAGAERTLRANTFVLACGGIENARLLLLSDSRIPGGLGNKHDLVGRFFADHAVVNAGTAVLMRPSTQALLYELGRIYEPRMKVHPQLRTTLSLARQVRTPRVIIRFIAERPSRPARLIEKISEFWDEGHQVPRTCRIRTFAEPLPLPENRITLLDTKDKLGMRQAKLVYRRSDLEHQATREALKKLASLLGAAGKGRLQIDEKSLAGPPINWGYHHYSTTKMHSDPRYGVVDADCRVHGIGNLFVAGSSVFPTAGLMTPTLTLVALALRLVDKLKGEMNA